VRSRTRIYDCPSVVHPAAARTGHDTSHDSTALYTPQTQTYSYSQNLETEARTADPRFLTLSVQRPHSLERHHTSVAGKQGARAISVVREGRPCLFPVRLREHGGEPGDVMETNGNDRAWRISQQSKSFRGNSGVPLDVLGEIQSSRQHLHFAPELWQGCMRVLYPAHHGAILLSISFRQVSN
jgi:hypothetical protein